MAKVRFYRGAAGTSLPQATSSTDGTIFIVERGLNSGLGDMYVDIDTGKRLHIIPDSEIEFYNSSMSGQTSVVGKVYFFQDRAGVAVGDGSAYIGDLPLYSFVTPALKSALSTKVNAYLGTEYRNLNSNQTDLDKSGSNKLIDSFSAQDASETLVLSREL